LWGTGIRDLVDWVGACACVAGGPAVGDIRSRCLRLSDQSTVEALAVRNLLGHRLPLDPPQAKSEWLVPHSWFLFPCPMSDTSG